MFTMSRLSSTFFLYLLFLRKRGRGGEGRGGEERAGEREREREGGEGGYQH